MYSKKYILLFMISYIKRTSSIWYFWQVRILPELQLTLIFNIWLTNFIKDYLVIMQIWRATDALHASGST